MNIVLLMGLIMLREACIIIIVIQYPYQKRDTPLSQNDSDRYKQTDTRDQGQGAGELRE